MFGCLSTQKGPISYERLGKEAEDMVLLNKEFKRSTSLPASAFNSSRKVALDKNLGGTLKRNLTKKDTKGKSHPLLSLLYLHRKKKTTARPEFLRYLEYVKEGGIWDLNSNKAVIYYN